MIRNELVTIAKHFSAYDVRFSDEEDGFDIVNPFGKDPIRVYVEDDPHWPYTVGFSFQHRHLATIDEAVAYADDIMSGNVFAIEFFKDGYRCFGGDLDAQEVRELSYDRLSQFLGCFGKSGLIDVVDSCKVRGWAEDADFDVTFVEDEQGNVTLKIIEASV